MCNKLMITAVLSSALTLLLSACEPAAQPKLLIAERYADNGDGSVTDIRTNLTWQRCSVGQTWTGETCTGETRRINWEEAMTLDNDDWRLPTIEELETLVFCSSGQQNPSSRPNGLLVKETDGECQGDYARPTINQGTFPNTPTGWFWSSSPYAGLSIAWGVNFRLGNAYGSSTIDGFGHVRLVREDQ